MNCKYYLYMAIAVCLSIMTFACKKNDPYFAMRGVVLISDDLKTIDWARMAHENGINTIGTHITPNQVVKFIQSEAGQKFMADCKKYGIAVEHQLHAMSELLPRHLFDIDSTMFRMDKNGRRVKDCNLCVHSQRALDTVAANAVKYARLLPATNHRYYYWIDDVKPMCACSKCAQYSDSEQALIVENRMLKALRKIDPKAQLAHLSYRNTWPAPVKVKPDEGIFLEFAPISRKYEKPLPDDAPQYLQYLKDNLKVFPTETAIVLEYWLDIYLHGNYMKPLVKVPWNRAVFEADIDEYAKLGIRNITTFSAGVDRVYLERYGYDMAFLNEYGLGLKTYAIDDTAHKQTNLQPPRKQLRLGKRIDDGLIAVDGSPNEKAWRNTIRISPFSNPWSEVRPATSLSMLHDSRNVYFLYEVNDTDIVCIPNIDNELDIAKGDRVELFFSKDSLMQEYYCFEVDAEGRTLAYSCSNYRKYKYDWDEPPSYAAAATRVVPHSLNQGYTVEIAVPKTFLSGLMHNNTLYFGAYRAEYSNSNGTIVENWQTWQAPPTAQPDFHVPESLGKLYVPD
ncbi:MAG: carbohydrate-binding family 9-like protein [Prevotellaceae bacterium]|nr:carbohydrate-binding family 9-like protein [Prevotellaceae bacterium]